MRDDVGWYNDEWGCVIQTESKAFNQTDREKRRLIEKTSQLTGSRQTDRQTVAKQQVSKHDGQTDSDEMTSCPLAEAINHRGSPHNSVRGDGCVHGSVWGLRVRLYT